MAHQLHFVATVLGIDAIFERPEVKALWENYLPHDMNQRKRILHKISKATCTAYIIPVNPEFNYGRADRVFLKYMLDEGDGLWILQELEVNTTLSGAPLTQAAVTDKSLYFSDIREENTKENRLKLSKTKNIYTQL